MGSSPTAGMTVPQVNDEPDDPNPPPRARDALKIREFRLYLIAVFALTVGVGFQSVALGAQIFDLTRSERALGLVGLAEALPAIGVALFAGHLADRRDRRRILLFTSGVLAACSLVFAYLATLPGEPSLAWTIYGVVAITGFARGVMNPARSAMGSDLVPRALLPVAVNLRTSVWQIGMCVGPLVGGVAYALFGAATAYVADAALISVAFFALLLMRKPAIPPARASPAISLRESLFGGVRFVFARREILGAITLDLFAVLFGGAIALLPKFAEDILGVGKEGLGLLRAAPPLGALLMAAWLVRSPPLRRAGRTLLVSVALFGACWIVFGLSRSFALSLALLVVAGAADYVSVVVRHTLVQTRTPTEMLGRVSAVNSIFIGSSNEIGAWETGEAAHLLGTVPSVVLGGSVTLLVVGVVAWRFPEIRRLDQLK